VGSYLVFWLCDGASDAKALPSLPVEKGEDAPPPAFSFSTRSLAQDLGQAFVKQTSLLLRDGSESLTQTDVPSIAFAEVAKVWNERLQLYLAIKEKRGELDKLLETLPRDGIDKSYFVIWSSTFIGGVFDPLEQDLLVWNYGDSGGLIMTDCPSVIPANANAVMLSARIRSEEQLQTEVKIVPGEKSERHFREGIEAFAVMSDGVDRANLDAYLNSLQKKTFCSLEELRADLLRSKDHTWDDKAIVFGRFVEE
jgi:hypothetical protein